MRFMVTGGAGFIGSALVRHLITETSHEVLNYDKLTYAGHQESVTPVAQSQRYTFVEGDINDTALLHQTLADFCPDRLVHLAAESHVDRSLDGPQDFVQTNIVGTFNLLDAALAYCERGGKTGFLFHHVSTDEVYGSLAPGTERFTEASLYAPNSPYSASKAAADHLVRAWGATYGLPVVISNCSNNYGPYQFPEKLIPLVILNALQGKPLPVYGDGANIRDWLYVDDHARALHLVATDGKPGETYNIGGDSEKTNLEVVNAICEQLEARKPLPGQGYKALINFVTDRPGHDYRYAIDASKIEQQLGWRPTETFATGLDKTIAWYLDNQAWCDAVMGSYSERRRLGLQRAPSS